MLSHGCIAQAHSPSSYSNQALLKKLLCLSAPNVFANFLKYVHDKRFNERPVVLLTSIFDSNMGMITKNSIHRK